MKVLILKNKPEVILWFTIQVFRQLLEVNLGTKLSDTLQFDGNLQLRGDIQHPVVSGAVCGR